MANFNFLNQQNNLAPQQNPITLPNLSLQNTGLGGGPSLAPNPQIANLNQAASLQERLGGISNELQPELIEEPVIEQPQLSREEQGEQVARMQDKQVALFQSGLLGQYDARAIQLANLFIEEQFESQDLKDAEFEAFLTEHELDTNDEKIYGTLMKQVKDIFTTHNEEGVVDNFEQTRKRAEAKNKPEEKPTVDMTVTHNTDDFIKKSQEVLMTITDTANGDDDGDGPEGADPVGPDDIKPIDEAIDEQTVREVIIVGAHTGHTIGNMLSDAGTGDTQNKYRSGNKDKTNDAFFQEMYNKVAQEDKDKVTLQGADFDGDRKTKANRKEKMSVIIDVNTGEIVDYINHDQVKAAAGVDQYVERWADKEGNSIEGKEFEHNGQNLKVVDSLFRWSSPLVLDLEGDGMEFSSVNDGTKFDLNGDGKKQNISWTKKQDSFDDAFLVMDKNGDGQINSGKELFGDQNGAANGYEELAKLDSNNDGKIDASDEAYSDLKLWSDMDGDGQVGEGEMKTLEEMNVTSIATGYEGTSGTEFDQHGNDTSLKSSFTRVIDGEEVDLDSVDVFFVEKNSSAPMSDNVVDYESLSELVDTVQAENHRREVSKKLRNQPVEQEEDKKSKGKSQAQVKVEQNSKFEQLQKFQKKGMNRAKAESLDDEISHLQSELETERAENENKELLESKPELPFGLGKFKIQEKDDDKELGTVKSQDITRTGAKQADIRATKSDREAALQTQIQSKVSERSSIDV